MKLNKLIVGIGVGLATGYFLNKKPRYESLSAEKALKKAKEAFKSKGKIDGSWIHMIPEKLTIDNIQYNVYRGGITQIQLNPEQETKQYEFLIDVQSGSILEVKELN